jgi:coatomer protein complex subunit gamma
MKRDKKEEEAGGNPYFNLEKSSVLQEARTFNETPINAKRCCLTLTKIMYLINQGEPIGKTEATEAFFAMTKLFQSRDTTLRRMVYLGIKLMANIADDVIIVTSSLTKDMTGKEEQFRAPAIRALCQITEGSMLQSIERYMKQAIVDKEPSVSSAALTSSLHLAKQNNDVVKRWVNEAQEAVNSDSIMVQYHALGLLYHIRKSDKLAVSKLVAKFTRHSLKSPYAYCHLIRIACKLLEEDDAGSDGPMYDFIESCLRHKSEMVIYEAAHAIVNMKHTTAKEMAPAVAVLQLFCGSSKPTLRFAAVRTLNKVAMKHPAAVTACNVDLENLITDSNRSIATLAITTLLKTGNESSVDRLMKQITSFMSEIPDEFKVVVVQAIRSLCLKFPRKHAVMMGFLSSMLREEGGFEYKRAIVDSIITIIEENSEAKESGLAHLCEFIEDCEHTVLATRILHLLGREGPRTPQPSKYIRFIYNRIILENPTVRAAAVSALAKFGAQCEELQPSILVLLDRSQFDTDDEVRDRATFYLNVLNEKQKSLNLAYIINGLQVSIASLERELHHYTLEPSETPFDLNSVPLAAQPITEAPSVTPGEAPAAKVTEKTATSRQDVYAEQLAAVPQLANLGSLFKSSAMPLELTESETEYIVRCVKHTFPRHIVFQFDCTNTLNDQLLENVLVQMENADGFEVIRTIPAPSLPYGKPGTTYTLVNLPSDPTQVSTTFNCILKFHVRDCDPNTGEADDQDYEDEYVLEDVELSVADHVQKVIKPNFGAAWDEIGESNELEDTYALSTMKNVEDAVKNILDFLGMQACERSDKIPEGKSTHTLYLAGVFRGGHDVLIRAKLAAATGSEGGVNMQMTVRSTDANVAQIMASVIG